MQKMMPMQALEFDSFMKDGVIPVPDYIPHYDTKSIRVIVLSSDETSHQVKKTFNAMRVHTKGFKFNREEANER
jgi:hypothetical protein